MATIVSGLYINGGQLQIIDLHDPTHQRKRGSIEFGATPLKVTIDGTRGYLAFYGDWGMTIRFLDVSDPDHPVLVGDHLSFAGSYGLHMAAEGNRLYVPRSPGIEIYDVGDVDQPRPIGSWEESVGSFDVIDGLAYVTNGINGFQILNLKDPENPVLLSTLTELGDVRDVAVANGLAYLTTIDNGLLIIDIQDPLNPISLGACALPLISDSGFGGLSVSGNLALARYSTDEISIIEVTDSTNPRLVSSYTPELMGEGYYWNFQVTDQTAFITGG